VEARDPALSGGNTPETVGSGGAAVPTRTVGLVPAAVLLGVLFAGALGGALKVSLVPLGDGLGNASLASWRDLLEDPAFWDGLLFTLRVSLISTTLAAILGVALALALRNRGGVLRTLAALPVPVPHLLVAVVASIWLAPGGIADRVLGGLPIDVVRDPSGLGITLVYVYKEAPFLALLVLASIGRTLVEREEAAAVMGMDGWERLRWVIWPAIRRPLLIGCVIVAAFAIGAFEVPLTLGPNYPSALSAYAFEAVQGDVIAGEGRAAAALLVAGLSSVVLAALAVRFMRGVDE
jgi:putative spermidine/putrescine transport system permease protein